MTAHARRPWLNRLSSQDEGYLRREGPNHPMHFVVELFVGPTDGPPVDVEIVRRHLDERIKNAPWLLRVVRRAPGGIGPMVWADDRHFCVDRHVAGVAGSDDRAGVTTALAEAAERRLPLDRPLWRVDVLPRLDDGRTPLLFAIHHALMDGGLFTLTMDRLFRPDGEPLAAAERPAARRASPTAPELLGYAVARRLVERLRRNRGTSAAAVQPPTAQPNGGVLTGAPGPRRAVASRSVPLSDVKALGRRMGATVNDLFVASATAALRDLVLERGGRLDPLLALIPKDVRSEPGPDDGNRTWSLHLELPIDLTDPHRRLEFIREGMARAKRATRPAGNAGFLFDVALSSVPIGAGHCLAGAPVQVGASAAPLQGHNRLLGVANGHNDLLTFAYTADADAFGDVERLAQRTIDELHSLARVPAG